MSFEHLKVKEKKDWVSISIKITRDKKEFIDKNSFSITAIFNDAVARLMKQESKGK